MFFFSNSDIEYNEAYTETDNLLKIILSYNVLSEYDILRESQVLKVNNKNKPSNQTDKNHYRKAKSRIQNHLSYKLGQALIENSKSIFGYIRIPYVLSYIKDKHKFEQKAYEEKIKENPNLALPPLETYPDYNEALKEKECFTYKLGEALIQASKNWYGGGYIKFAFKDVPRLKREFRKR
ncbi:alpha-2,3-sialyltransferase [Campylobacter jejuni subsp. doylei 269.97]|uniref:Alpha-2,3-sialyltransferase n=1 Tax=Campylobacter jejuni subsp. doylei (strain ATCC BAA-1458 / RM4099 / 269.97) TaxID=360109 RepID=A7H5H1_CAMJD|nr:alpha-2,3-sialyltransferase [Campylobacter jejuni subsp. doylei 269.97]